MIKKFYEGVALELRFFAQEDVIKTSPTAGSTGGFNSTEEGGQFDPFSFN